MLYYALIVFAVAALGGLFLASFVLRDRFAPWAVSLLHAGLGATGLVLTGIAVFGGGGTVVEVGLAILVVAALGGFYLAFHHLKKVMPPKALVLIHAGVAVTGFLVLLAAALRLV
jgi:hypothetical protein